MTNDEAQRRPPEDRPALEHPWQISFRVGQTLVNHPSGFGTLPAPGIPINTLFGSWTEQVPSWYFGNGTTILNGALRQLQPSPRLMVPLDAVLTTAAITRHNGPVFGGTIERQVSSRYGFEFSLDVARDAPTFSAPALATIESSRASYVSAWTGLLAPLAVTNVAVTSTSAIANGGSLELLVTTALNITLHATPKSTWFATIGGGLESLPGSGPTAKLVGHSAFMLAGPAVVPYDQTDTVAIQGVRTGGAVGILGGGWSLNLSRRWGVSTDVRLTASRAGVKTVLNATPGQTLQPDPSHQVVLVVANSPSIVFNNASLLFLPSTLSALPVSSFTTFAQSGVQLRTQLSVEFFLRF